MSIIAFVYNSLMVITFRPLLEKDYTLFASWLAQEHVAQWWHEPATIEFIEKEYGPSDPKTDVYVVEGDGKPMGIIQSYWTQDYPEHFEKVQLKASVGVDLFIGEPDLIGKGYGTQLLANFVDSIIKQKYPAADCVVADPEVTNLASVRAFEKAGFSKGTVVNGEHGPEQLMILKI